MRSIFARVSTNVDTTLAEGRASAVEKKKRDQQPEEFFHGLRRCGRCNKELGLMETIFEIRPHRGGWQCFEVPGVQPYYDKRDDTLSYAHGRTAMRRGEIPVFDSVGGIEKQIPVQRARADL